MRTETSVPRSNTREARFEARLTARQKALFLQAASLSGSSLSEFVVASAQQVAARLIEEHETIRLTRREQVAFVTALLAPRA